MSETKALRFSAAYRLAQGKSLGDLSRATGIEKGTLSRIERGDLRPNLLHLLAIGRALGLRDLVGAIEAIYP